MIWKEQGLIFGSVAADYLGSSVALSADGNILAVGAPGDYVDVNRTGYVRLYTPRILSSWEQIGLDIIGDNIGDHFGSSVALSPDGRTLAVGAPAKEAERDGVMPGYVRIFSITEADDSTLSWQQLGRDIIGKAPVEYFGYSVSLSDDGTTVAIGAVNDNNGDPGIVRIYQLDNTESNWVQLGDDIDGKTAGDESGWAVSLSADGRTVAIGSPYFRDDGGAYTGQVRVFSFNATIEFSWEQLGQDIIGDFSDDDFGLSVAISADGSTLAVGAPADGDTDDRPGYARVYSFEDSDWQQIGDDINGTTIGGSFGWSLSLSGDGKTVAVGDPFADSGNLVESGCVRVYHIDDTGSNWIQLGDDIDGGETYRNFGWALSLSADGKSVAVGTPASDDGKGNARVFIAD